MKGQSVVVTGGAGFIGSHLVEALLADGRRVTVIDDLSSGREDRVPDEADLERVDISDRVAIDEVFDRVRPAAAFHLGAQSSVTVSVKDPGRDCAVNVGGTLNVLEAASRHSAPVVMTSTGGALYGNDAEVPTPETHPPAPLAPYGASKAAGEVYVGTWAASKGIPHSVCRLGNVYGPRQSPFGEAGVVAIFTHRLWAGEVPVLYGHGRPTRDYVHVRDVVDALVRANGVAGTFNIATGEETATAEIYRQLVEISGIHLEPNLEPLRPGELERSCMDPTHAARALGWRAEVALAAGLRETHDALVEEFEGQVDP